jgi:nitroreductase
MAAEKDRATLIESRYAGQETLENISFNDTIATILNHRSVRAFLADPLPMGTIETMVAAAQSASTSSNLHQWSVIAVTDKDMKARLGELARMDSFGMGQPYIDEAPLLLLWIVDLSRSHALATSQGADPVALAYLDPFLTAAFDTALAAQNAIIAAESLGLGCVCIGALRNKSAEVAELVGLPQRSIVGFGVVVGWEDESRPSEIRPRPRQAASLHHDRYDEQKAMDALEDYEDAMKGYQERRGMKVRGWKSGVARLAEDPKLMDGRENLRRFLTDRRLDLL